MRSVTVNASRTYSVHIGSGLLRDLGKYTKQVCNCSCAAIISDSNVSPLYEGVARTSLESEGIRVLQYTFPAGESSKNGTVYLDILNFLAENQMTRSDCIVALGGGVVGDMAGFVAATFLRGICCIQVPTTLLAAVDSSVGGKTAIDLPAGKNLAGAFFQPSLVLCDTDTLHSLPENVFRDGCAEVIKYGIIYDPALFSLLSKTGLDFPREEVIARCVELKRDVVSQDEFDTGARQKLNLGHTVGHGVEAQSNFTLSHGKAVAIGTAIVTRSAEALGLCSSETRDRILAVIEAFGLPTGTNCDAATLAHYALSDKKRTGGSVNLIVPLQIGNCVLRPTAIHEIQSFIEAGL